MNNGIFTRKWRTPDKKPAWYWRFDDEVSADFGSREDAERSYIERLLNSRYGELLRDKPYEKQHALVFGAAA